MYSAYIYSTYMICIYIYTYMYAHTVRSVKVIVYIYIYTRLCLHTPIRYSDKICSGPFHYAKYISLCLRVSAHVSIAFQFTFIFGILTRHAAFHAFEYSLFPFFVLP